MSKVSDLEKENEELKVQVTQLESQIDSYRLGKEMEAWPSAVDVIKEGLTGDIEKQKKELADLIRQVQEAETKLKDLHQVIEKEQDLTEQVNVLVAEITRLESKAARLRGEYDLTSVMQIIRKLGQAYDLIGETFHYKLGKSDDLTLSDVETLVRRAIKTLPT